MASVMDWNQDEGSGMVESDGQATFLMAQGPVRQSPKTPAVVIIHGLGGTYQEWLPASKMIAKFARVYLYERAGYRPSDKSLKPRTPSNIVAELRAVLAAADVQPPYVLVGHSLGGGYVRQCLANYEREEIAGAVLVDHFSDSIPGFPGLGPLLGDTSYESVVGLDANHAFGSDEEFHRMVEYSLQNEGPDGVVAEELKCFKSNAQDLKHRLEGKQIMGNKPLSVMNCNIVEDLKKLYAHAEKHGHGSPDAREAARKAVETAPEYTEMNTRAFLEYSSNHRYVSTTGKARTHNVQTIAPEAVVDEVEWVCRQVNALP